MKITEYESKGKKLYKWSGYVGTDEVGQFITARRGFITKRDAELHFMRFKTEFDAGKHHRKNPNTINTLQELYSMWLPTYKDTVTPATLNKTTQIIEKHFIMPYGNKPLYYFTPVVVQGIVNELQTKLLTFKKTLNYLNKLFKMALVVGVMETNPLERVTIPKPRKKLTTAVKVLDYDQFNVFWRIVIETYQISNPMAYTFLRLLSFTGMRRGEALALSWSDLDQKHGFLSIHKSLTLGMNNKPYISQTAKTDAGNRTIKLDNGTFRTLIEYYETYKPDQSKLIFTTQKNTPLSLNTPQKWLNAIERVANKKLPHLHPHMLRHTFITLTLSSGKASVKQVQYMVGHNDVSVTMNIYNHITSKQAESAGDVFANLIEN